MELHLFFHFPGFHPQHLLQDDAQKADVNKLAPSRDARFSKLKYQMSK